MSLETLRDKGQEADKVLGAMEELINLGLWVGSEVRAGRAVGPGEILTRIRIREATLRARFEGLAASAGKILGGAGCSSLFVLP